MALSPTWGTGEYFIPLRLVLLARMIEREMARDLQAGFDITVADWRVLALACTLGSSSAPEIRTVFEADRAEVSRAVARLVKADLVRLEPDERHRQKMRIKPTDAGQTVFDGVRPMREAYFATIMQDLSHDERRSFDKAMESIALRVDELRSAKNADGPPIAPLGARISGLQSAPGSEGRHGEADPAAAGDDGDPDSQG